MNISWLGIYFFFLCLNMSFYMIGQHLSAIGDPLASEFGVVDPKIYNLSQPTNKTNLVGNMTQLGNYTDGGSGSPFNIFEQATEIVIQGGYTLWQALTLGFVFNVLTNAIGVADVSMPYLPIALAQIFGLAFVLFVGYMIFGRQPS